jgi:outer membrane lipoprotein-sorting protein
MLAAATVLGQSAPSLDQIVNRLEKAQTENHANLRPYTVTRHFQILSGDHDEKTDSDVKATVSFVPPDKQDFKIDSATGNERGIAAVKRILESETQLRDQGTSAGFTRENYDFTSLSEATDDGRACYVLGLNPKHKEKHLVKGQLWVDAQTFLPRKVDGELARSPSWWVKDVHVTTDFHSVSGMWLPTTTQAVADVRIFGRHTLMSQATNFNTGEQVASAMPPQEIRHVASETPHPRALTSANTRVAVKRRPTRPVPIILGTGVLVER